MKQKGTIDALLIEPGKKPLPVKIRSEQISLAEAIGAATIQYMIFEGAPFVFVYDYYAESKGRPQNRALRDEHGHVFGIIPGSFLVVGWTGKSHCSLASDWMETFVDLFAVPEAFVMKGRELHIVPIYDNCSPEYFPS